MAARLENRFSTTGPARHTRPTSVISEARMKRPVLSHRAPQDAEATAEALQHLLQRAEDQGLDGEAFLASGEVPWSKV